jgi:glycerol-3-phosphate dehydrogenase
VIIAGGKYTTYRVMAKDAVDLGVKVLDRPVPECLTDKVPLVGAAGYEALLNTKDALAARSGLSVDRIDHLLGRYGSAVREVLDLIAEHPELGEPLEHAPRYLKVEAYYGASHEGALHLDDLLARRLRVSVDTWDRGVDVAHEVADIVAPLLGWDGATVENEVEHYRKRVDAERESQQQTDDQTADSARLGAPEVRVGVG